jgi:DNA repair protein RadC
MGDLLNRLRADIPTLPLSSQQQAVLSTILDVADVKRLAEAQAPTPATPPMPNAAARARIAETSAALAHEPVEHMVCWGLDAHGALAFETSYSQGHAHQVQPDLRDVIRRCRESQASAVILVHNHPPGCDPGFSPQDTAATSTQTAILQENGITLLSSRVVSPPDQAPLARVQDALPSAWELREAEERRLWAPYGGVRPRWAGGR